MGKVIVKKSVVKAVDRSDLACQAHATRPLLQYVTLNPGEPALY